VGSSSNTSSPTSASAMARRISDPGFVTVSLRMSITRALRSWLLVTIVLPSRSSDAASPVTVLA